MDNNYNCPNCGRPLVFDDNSGNYFCMDCGGLFLIEDLVKKESENDNVIVNDFTNSYTEITCKLCGQKTIVDKDYSYGVCPFCYNNLIEYNNVVDFSPELIINFKEEQKDFITHVVDVLKNDNCPPELIAGVKLNSLRGLYIPFYRYTVENTYRCFLETVEKDNRFGNDGFYYQEIDYMNNLNVLCDATKMIPNEAINDFANYDYKQQKMFFPKMLGKGFYTVSNYETHDKVWKELKNVVKNYTEKEMNKYVGKTEEIKNIILNCDIKNIVKKFILLPVWILETTYKEETHYIYINGQTNRVASDISYPRTYKKTMFGKEIVEHYQVEFVDEMKIKYKRFKSGIDYHNEVRKYDNNSATKDQRIGAMRTR